MQKIINYIRILSKSQFVKNLSITFSENMITKFFGFFITLILVRNLGPANYGIYSFILVNILVFSALFDFGMENTAIRFSNQDKEKTNTIFGLYFIVKVLILFVFIFVISLGGGQILLLIHKTELIKYIPFFILGFIGESLFFVNDTYLQCIQKFKLRAIINVSRQIFLFAIVLFLVLKKILILKYVLFTFLIAIVFSLFFIPRYLVFIKSFFSKKISKVLLKNIFNYEKWMFVLASINGLLGRIDIYMLSFWATYSQLGIYSAAYNLLSIVSFLPYVFGKVMLPKMAETKKEDLFMLTIKMAKPIIFISLTLLLFIPIFPYIVPFLFGHKYDDSIAVVQMLSVATLISFVLLPFEQSMYPLGKPKYTSFLKFAQLILSIILNLIFIPKYGMLWAAINLIIARLFYGSLLITVFNNERKEYV